MPSHTQRGANLRRKIKDMAAAEKRAEKLLAREFTPEFKEMIFEIVKEACEQYLNDFMTGQCTTFGHNPRPGSDYRLLEAFLEGEYEWLNDLYEGR